MELSTLALLGALVAVPAYLFWEDRRRRRRLAARENPRPADLVGLTGLIVKAGPGPRDVRVRLTDRQGHQHTLPAVFETDGAPMKVEQEVLVIVAPSAGGPMVVDAADLPILEELVP